MPLSINPLTGFGLFGSSDVKTEAAAKPESSVAPVVALVSSTTAALTKLDAVAPKMILPPPNAPALKHKPLIDFVNRMEDYQSKLDSFDSEVGMIITDLKASSPSSPRRSIDLFDELKETHSVHKAIPFTESALKEMIQNTFGETADEFKQLKEIDNAGKDRSEKRLESSELLELCRLNKSIASKYYNLLNKIQGQLKVWSIPENVAIHVMGAYPVLKAVADVTQDVIEPWLYTKVEKEKKVLDMDILKVFADIKRLKEWVEIYRTPRQELTVSTDAAADNASVNSAQIDHHAPTPVNVPRS